MPNIRDIAKEAKVSVATISRFLNPEERRCVHFQTCQRIEKVIQKYQYTPNRIAQALSRKITNTLGIVTPFSADVVKSPYFQGLIAGVIEGIRPLAYDLKWIMVRSEELQTCSLSRLLREHSVDGIIFLTWRLFPHLVEEIQGQTSLPAVLINDYDPKVRSSIVYCENQSGVIQLCSYFISKGYRRVGMIRGPEYASLDARQRFRAFKACVKKYGLVLKSSFLYECPRFEEEAGYQTMRLWLQKGSFPDVIFCANDDIAAGALRALREKKIKVPREIAIAGYDDSKKMETLSPSLTTIRQPLEVMGKAAVDILAGLISKTIESPVRLKFEPKLVIRESA